MEKRSAQVNHPAIEKSFKENAKGFEIHGEQIIRLWNSDDNHYRKFIRNSGVYLKNNSSNPKSGILNFWGEWEGHSFFEAVDSENCTGIHTPFHSNHMKGKQNTDPYVFGDFFKYAICSQTGVMTRLKHGSLILFGTTTKRGFLLDTVFVVKTSETAQSVSSSQAKNYTETYKEETLTQLRATYLEKTPTKNSLYQGTTWFDNKMYFSYVPCKIEQCEEKSRFDQVLLETPPMSSQRVGHPYNHLKNYAPEQLWDFVTQEVIKQGFKLAIQIDEPKNNDILKEMT